MAVIDNGTTRVGLVALGAKPYHAGHAGLVGIAARENDAVQLYVSLGDRYRTGEAPILGSDMEAIWRGTIEASLPANVTVEYVASPVGSVFKTLGEADRSGSTDLFTVYADPDDAALNYATLPRYAPRLVEDGLVKVRPVDRSETTDVSGTQMRQWLTAGDRTSFIAHLPRNIDRDAVWSRLRATVENPPAGLKHTDKAKKKKGPPPPKQQEALSLLRCYIRSVL